jgi:hypothetical protein
MQGLYIHGERPRTKKSVREAIAKDPSKVRIEATSIVGDEYDGPASDMPEGKVYFVGPDPERSRRFYGTIVKHNGTLRVT